MMIKFSPVQVLSCIDTLLCFQEIFYKEKESGV